MLRFITKAEYETAIEYFMNIQRQMKKKKHKQDE
jgi:hypothetical protein